MEKKKVFDKRQVKLEEMLKKGYIPLFSGRPRRETIISNDEIMNLEILLNTTESVDDFLARI